MQSAVQKLGEGWHCTAERAAERVLVLALSGWKPQDAVNFERLSHFVPGQDDPFRRACVMLRHHFEAPEQELGEPINDADRTVWMETLFQALQERREDGSPALLADLLSGGDAA